MSATPHLLVTISGHGFGHAAQAAPLLNALGAALPGLRLSLRSRVPEPFLRGRIHHPFALQAVADDFGMLQPNALEVDVAASFEAYRLFHHDWQSRVDTLARELEARAPDLVLSDVAYLPLAAARQVGIPALALCCLNWADIFHHYCAGYSGAGVIHAQILEAYNSAGVFMRTEPAMPMAGLDNLYPIGPLAVAGASRRQLLAERLGLAADERLVLATLGGFGTRLPLEAWPVFPRVRWVVQADWGIERPDVIPLESLGLPMAEVLASCDALLTKPGYASFTEAAASGVPVLYVPRADWPEQPYLEAWLQAHGRCRAVGRKVLWQGRFGAELEALLDAGPYPPVAPEGVGQALDCVRQHITGG